MYCYIVLYIVILVWSDLLGATGGLKLNPTAFKRSCDDQTAGGSLVSARRCTCRAQTASTLQPLLTSTSLQQLPVFGRRSRLFLLGGRWPLGFYSDWLKAFQTVNFTHTGRIPNLFCCLFLLFPWRASFLQVFLWISGCAANGLAGPCGSCGLSGPGGSCGSSAACCSKQEITCTASSGFQNMTQCTFKVYQWEWQPRPHRLLIINNYIII